MPQGLTRLRLPDMALGGLCPVDSQPCLLSPSIMLSPLTIGPFALLFLAIPVLLFGEMLARHVGWIRRSNIPPAIIGGLLAALVLFALAEFAPGRVTLQGSTGNAAWLWPVLPQLDFSGVKPTDVERPLLILFFTCVGLNASWGVARRGGIPLVVYLVIAAFIGVLQAVTGVATARALGENPLMGLMAGNVALMGGFGTAAGFASDFEKAGLQGAATIGIAAAAFGVIAGGLLAGFVGGRLVEGRLQLRPRGASGVGESSDGATGFVVELRELGRQAGPVATHLLLLLGCMKVGAFLSVAIQRMGVTFPVYMGSMLVAAAVRNIHDAVRGSWIRTEMADGIGSVALMWMLAVVMVDLQLSQLAHAALPMLIILAIQVTLIAVVCYWLVFRLMGKDYEAACMSAGMIGFGLGATSNAVATLRVLAVRFGPAPRAFLIVPIVGAFLIDFFNAFITTTALNLLR
jgi:glutamate:Na+ symporter, ESS family